ncbi:hypothetical protein FA95DRAFT_481512 [Auriscalpium vulgare]|uniref:Uncharacterized protein n=1 Tax=Auriscalpium vulgare TaxID=40419 RepID=A0ACB8SCW8_9AGAM|nr:hypothetical protein FA95DRAFT_481512 [Auriscalpium vulgare]
MTGNDPETYPPSAEPPQTSSPLQTSTTNATLGPVPTDRAELLDRARMFLRSPLSRYEDVAYQRQFLVEKGLTEQEIAGLLRERPVQAPAVPPRTYPQPPPSNLPHLLAGVLRILSWVAGGSAAFLLIYYRFLLPRLTQSALARRSIKSHQQELLMKLTSSLHGLRDAQTDTFAVLPRPLPTKEPMPYVDCKSLDDIVAVSGEKHDVSEVSLLRCALNDLSNKGREGTPDELFRELLEKIPWLEADTGYQESLWKTLNETPLFSRSNDSNKPPRWAYDPPPLPLPAPLLPSLDSLNTALWPLATRSANPFQHTLQGMIDFTGYLTTQTYSLSSSAIRMPGLAPATLGTEEEEVRREIRALKGLVLNRRSFLPSRPSSTLGVPIAP